MSTHAEDLDLLKRAAREAGTIALSYFRREPQVFWKEGNSPVSQADLAVDGFLRDFLLSARPLYGWVSEETASEPPHAGETRYFVVDPIDGTRSFLRGEPTWCVSLAVIENQRPVAGVIDVPVLAKVYTATAGRPALLNGRPFEPRTPGASSMSVSLPEGVLRQLTAEERAGFDIRKTIPSLAYRLAMVATGEVDGTIVQPRANDWDIAAADLLLECSGGRLVGLDGNHHLYKPDPKRHGLLIAGAADGLERLRAIAAALPSERRPSTPPGSEA